MHKLTRFGDQRNLLLMSSTWFPEARWLGANLALLLVYLFGLSLVQAVVMLASSTDGSIAPGWSGNPMEQVVDWGTMTAWFAVFYSPLIAVFLAPYRVLVGLVGHPRLVALLTALVVTGFVGLMVQNVGTSSLVLVAIAATGYAAIMRLPGQTLAELPATVRGGIVGLALSFVWIVGSIAALAWAAYLVRRAAWTEAGAVALAATAVPAMTLFADLFRDGVPAENYLVTAVLLGGMVTGMALLLIRPIRRRPSRSRPLT